MKAVEGVFEEECEEAVGPGVRPKQIERAQLRAAEADPSEELELERGLERKEWRVELLMLH